MAFVVEDGNGLPNATAYIDTTYADAYFADRNVATWAAGILAAKQAAIIVATDYLDTVWGPKFTGTKAFVSYPPVPATDQALEFPRDTRVAYVGNPSYYADVQYYGPVSYTGDPLAKPVVIPDRLKKACAEYALRALLNGALLVDPEVDPTGLQIEDHTTVVGPITETKRFFSSAGVKLTKPYPAADLLLKPLLRPGGAVRG